MIGIHKTPALTADTILESLREIFPQIQKQYQINTLGILGSYVRGEATEASDIDLLIEFQPDIRFGLIAYCQLENYLSEKLGKQVDLVTKDGLKPDIGENILKEVVYL
ncbi:MAG: nucleotidyltransferase family protein [Roseofilum sp. SBFL]|uniref:nucleotidyltransferase family protein n=1 Tax=unclassified Roseofilum TaxID=2620099 RepID=UPI001B0601E6|nr:MULTISPECIES: nucleotidyltransferase family protein [unclassified Roseofilum]MBP0013511.1 nucleotidyltransferase family protein [Roseofilum sp. SID3]MBP0024709.1 nucleotidyltransferase family protein [Roseofilum sp. SID2]MBP0039516.1 nucleotidyltransferase family protein [Roseofilum sp. SID1]MBP0042542.1 nucleotidyltransferase family protein [Roseofilum sp. SBFL]